MYNKELYQYLVERNPIAQIVLNFRGQIVYWNKSAENLYKFTVVEVIDKKIEDLILFDINDIQKQLSFVKAASFPNESKIILNLITRDKYQVEIPVKIDFTFIEMEENLVMLTIVDRSQEHRSEQQLIRKQKQLEKYIESNLQLENFTFIASHNLKLPIQNIINFSGYLNKALSERLSSKEKQYLTIIEENSSRMKDIIQLLADYSSISNIPLNKTIITTDQALAKVLKELEPKIVKTEAIIHLGELPEIIVVDKYLFRQLFMYLIDNSLLFTKKSLKPEIYISAIQKNSHYIFSIKDNGIGIDKAFSTSIFGMFKRLHTEKEYEGYGIGLAFCKKIVERHDGDIWVESSEGEGSEFFVRIPIEQ